MNSAFFAHSMNGVDGFFSCETADEAPKPTANVPTDRAKMPQPNRTGLMADLRNCLLLGQDGARRAEVLPKPSKRALLISM